MIHVIHVDEKTTIETLQVLINHLMEQREDCPPPPLVEKWLHGARQFGSFSIYFDTYTENKRWRLRQHV